jgi:hypothetical protein
MDGVYGWDGNFKRPLSPAMGYLDRLDNIRSRCSLGQDLYILQGASLNGRVMVVADTD